MNPVSVRDGKRSVKLSIAKNNKHLAKKTAPEFKSSVSTSDNASIVGTEPLEEGGELKFSLMDIRDDKSYLFDNSLYAHPLGEFTAPKNLDTYPGGLLEYIAQCARKKGAKRIGFKHYGMQA